MSRPENVSDIPLDRRVIDIGTIDTERFLTDPALMKPYTALVEAIQKQAGSVDLSYGTNVTLRLQRNKKQLDEELRSMQYQWDENQKYYNRALNPDPVEPMQDYIKSRVKEWAEQENLPNPFDVFAANDPELAQMRKDLGMDD